jgi:hypothetical protein
MNQWLKVTICTKTNLSSDCSDDVESSDSDYIPLTPPEQRKSATSPVVRISDSRQVMSQMRVIVSHESNFHDTDSKWVDMTENNDNQPQANFQYKELHGPKHAPPHTNSEP